jgi:hypothetical protein
LVDGSGPTPFDLLLATATDPTLENDGANYASSETVAAAWNRATPDFVSYFRKNHRDGIRTFQDDDIESFLNP